MHKFSIIRNSGFGDYVGVTRSVCSILGDNFTFVVFNKYKYKNYHCTGLDFLEVFYNGEYLDCEEELKSYNLIGLLELVEKNQYIEKYFNLLIGEEDFKYIKNKNLDINKTSNLFSYKPTQNPFNKLNNKITLHIRASDLASNQKIIRPIINPNKIEEFILKNIKLDRINLIVCSDSEKGKASTEKLQYQIENINFKSKKIKLIKKFLGADKDNTVSTMNSLFYSDIVITKSSCFVHLFKNKKITVPDEYCFLDYKEIL